MKKLLTALALGVFTFISISMIDTKNVNLSDVDEQISGEPLPPGWHPFGTLIHDPISGTIEGTSAYYAEYLFWKTFHGQEYSNTDKLLNSLFSSLDDDLDDFSKALVYGRIGFTFLWIYSEAGYAEHAKKIDVLTLNRKHITKGKNAVIATGKKLLINKNFKSSPRVNPHYKGPIAGGYKPTFVGIQIATYYFEKAVELIMDQKTPSQLQNWTTAEGSSLIPGSELAWKTYPSVVTGFYASFDAFPPPPFNTIPQKTMPMSLTMESISYSKGFNFATHVFGDVGGNHLSSRDLEIMIQMIQLGSDPEVMKSIVLGNTSSYPKHGQIYQSVNASLEQFYLENEHLNVIQKKLFPPSSLSTIWNKPIPWQGSTPVEIVKASSGTSLVVPNNFENNLLMLGDTFVATYYKVPGKGEPAWEPPNESWVMLLTSIYTIAMESSTWDSWPYQSSIINRLGFLKNKDYVSLYNAAQNYSFNAEPPNPANPVHYPSCMTCHQVK